jgi:AsmA family
MKSIPVDATGPAPLDVSSDASSPATAASPDVLLPGIWMRRILWFCALLAILWAAVWALTSGASFLVQHTRLKDRLTARIAVALGRPVEVGSYDFTFWGGPTLDAQSVSVAEDSRFGQEYFLRAESISLRLRWSSLLRGHLAIDTLSLARPSLNLVLNDAGDWNLAEWLPRPSATSSTGAPYPLPPSPSVRFRRIEVDGGRINFKRSDSKLPIALVGLTGAAETDTSGRWRIDLTATPWRAAVPVQQAGTLHVSGYVGGTSSRLRPAKLDISWSDASLSDVLRLARADDSGIRGALGASINAATHEQDDAWTIHAHVQLSQIHRWDLGLRADNPAVNVIFETDWRPAGSSLELSPLVVEGPHSSARLSAKISWAKLRVPAKQVASPVYAELSGAQIDMADLLSWVRAFRTGVADDASLSGIAAVRGVVDAWPLRVENAVVSTDGVTLTSGSVRTPARLGEFQARYDRGLVSVLPAEISFGASDRTPPSVLRFESSAKSGRGVSNTMHLAGSLSDVRDLLASASALGWQLARDSDLSGPVRGDLRWQGSRFPWQEPAAGFIEWGVSAIGGSLRAPFLNLPVEQIRARLELKPGARHATLSSAQAFGAHWTGTFDRRDVDPEWQFSLSADHVSAPDLDRWLNPLWRQGFLGRMFPFLNSRSAPAQILPDGLRAAGRLNLATFTLASLALNNLHGDLNIDGRVIGLQNATAQLSGGAVAGLFTAHLDPLPSYESEISFSRVDISSITDASPLLAGFFDGSATGEASFRARGLTRANLLASLDCRGNALVARPLLRKVDLASSLSEGVFRAGSSHLSGASADFSCAQQVVRLENLSLGLPGFAFDPQPDSSGDFELKGDGTVAFDRDINIALHASESQDYRLTGTLAAPQIAVTHAAPLHRSR